MIGIIEQGHCAAAIHPRDSASGRDPEIFLSVEEEGVDSLIGQARRAIDNPQDIALDIDQDDASAKGADSQSVISNRDRTGVEIILDELTAIAGQGSELGSFEVRETGKCNCEKSAVSEGLEVGGQTFYGGVVRHHQHRFVPFEFPKTSLLVKYVDGVADFLGDGVAGTLQWPDAELFPIPPHDLVDGSKDDASRGHFDPPNLKSVAISGWKLRQQRVEAHLPGHILFEKTDVAIPCDPDSSLFINGKSMYAQIVSRREMAPGGAIVLQQNATAKI